MTGTNYYHIYQQAIASARANPNDQYTLAQLRLAAFYDLRHAFRKVISNIKGGVPVALTLLRATEAVFLTTGYDNQISITTFLIDLFHPGGMPIGNVADVDSLSHPLITDKVLAYTGDIIDKLLMLRCNPGRMGVDNILKQYTAIDVAIGCLSGEINELVTMEDIKK